MSTNPLAQLRRDALEGLIAGGLIAAIIIVCALVYFRAAGGLGW